MVNLQNRLYGNLMIFQAFFLLSNQHIFVSFFSGYFEDQFRSYSKNPVSIALKTLFASQVLLTN